MRLLLDLGNTRLKWALAQPGGTISAMQALVPSSDSSCWRALIDDLSIQPIHQIALSSVAGAGTQALREVLTRQLPDAPILEAQSRSFCAGVTNGYRLPQTLGVDRFMALLGAFSMHANTQVIAMLGTALTIDVLHPGGMHAGGLIAPGPSLMQTSLHFGTANLPLTNGEAVALGKSTADAIASGCQRACAALIEAVWHDFPGATLLLSGGAASAIVPLLSCPAKLVPKLVLQGLQRFADTAESGQ